MIARRRWPSHWAIGFHGLCGLIYGFLVVPIVIIVPLSFSSGTFLNYPLPDLSLRWYIDIFESYKWGLAFRNSFIVATAAMILSVGLGIPAALGLNRVGFPFKRSVMGFLISPLIVPIIISAVGLYFFFAEIGLGSTLTGLVLAHTVIATPFVIVAVSATLEGFDNTLVLAAKGLGATELQAFRRITLPLILPGVLSGALFAFAASFDEVVIALFLTGPEQLTLPRQLFSGLRDELNPGITAVATVMIGISLVLMVTIEYLRRRSNRLRGIREH
jgi:putative spermidine/putrescine transport system permease protein